MSDTVTIGPTAIDGYVYIDSIRVAGRHRRELGDVASLAESILDVGLINPITITGSSTLVAGERRLAACRSLGWDSVPVRIVNSLTEASQLLRAERDENTCRKDMLPSEKASLGAALEEIEAVEARERQREAGRHFGNGVASSGAGGSYVGRETSEVVGEALGMSRSTYAELKFAHKVATDPALTEEERSLGQRALADMDLGGGVQPTVTKLRETLKAQPAPEPPEFDRTAGAKDRRIDAIRELAERGNTSRQIGEAIGLSASTVRLHARDANIRIPADEATSRTRHIDANRVVRQTVQTLEGLAMGVGLVVDDLHGIDVAEVETWANSLTQSVRAINRLIKEIKRMKEQNQ